MNSEMNQALIELASNVIVQIFKTVKDISFDNNMSIDQVLNEIRRLSESRLRAEMEERRIAGE